MPTNMLDATSKCCAGQLSNGTYYIVSNPNPTGERIPLTIALSDDGCVFSRLAVLHDEPTAPRLPGRFKGPGYQYPNAIERGGQLHIIYSVNKEDVEVQSVSLDELTALPSLVSWPTRSAQTARNKMIYDIPPGPGNPRNSEGDTLLLPEGGLISRMYWRQQICCL